MSELLAVAQKHQFAVPAFNIGSHEILKGVIEVVEETNSPVILEIHPDELSYLGESYIEAVKNVAFRSPVPIVIHLDHGSSVQQVMRAIKCGFTSVMIDASHLPYEQNLNLTSQVVALAHSVNVSVEAELGTIGNVGNSMEPGTVDIIYTDPTVASDFVAKTGIDTLAVAIGTAHGLYPKSHEPKLRIDILKEINEQVSIPLVLHGGSSNSEVELTQAIDNGICKINISSDIKSAFFNATREYLNQHENAYEPNSIFPNSIEAMKKVIKQKLTLFRTINKAPHYYERSNKEQESK